MTLFAALVREHSDPRAAKQPSRTLRAVVAALDELGAASTAEVARTAQTWQGNTHEVLHRLLRYGCVDLNHGEPTPNGLHRATVWTLTDLGRALARDLKPGGDDQ